MQTLAEDPADPGALPEGMISTLLTDRQGRLWGGTEGGGIAVMTGREAGRMHLHRLGRLKENHLVSPIWSAIWFIFGQTSLRGGRPAGPGYGVCCRMNGGRDLNDGADDGPEFRRGWEAAILAVSLWHASKAKQTLVQARRSRFPKSLEAEAALHERCAEAVKIISPDDV